METVKASITWSGAERGVLILFREPTPDLWEPDPTADPTATSIALLCALDQNERETGEVAGVEIIDFLVFDRWQDLPTLPTLWQLHGWQPLPLDELLRRVQQDLRQRALAAARDQSAASTPTAAPRSS